MRLIPGNDRVDAAAVPDVGFLHIGKTGGTSVLRSVATLARERGRQVLWLNHDARLPPLLTLFPHLRITCTLRDPVERWVSGFNSRLRGGRPARDVPWTPGEAAAFSFFAVPQDLATAFGSRDPRQVSAARFAQGAISHLRRGYAFHFGSARWVRENAERFASIARVETLEADLPRLLEGLELAPPDGLHAPRLHETPAAMTTTLPDDARAALREVLAEEVAIHDALLDIRARRLAPSEPTHEAPS